MEEEGDLIMRAIEMMYQQCILGTMDEIVATTTVMTPMILTIKTLSTVCYGLVSIVSFQSAALCHVLPGCCIGPDGINIVTGALETSETQRQTKRGGIFVLNTQLDRLVVFLLIGLSLQPFQ